MYRLVLNLIFLNLLRLAPMNLCGGFLEKSIGSQLQ